MSRITSIETRREPVPLIRPYTISLDEGGSKTTDAVEIVYLTLRDAEGRCGHGAASPADHVTGETLDACADALTPDQLAWLEGRDAAREAGALRRQAARRMAATPAARAAVDIALWDLLAQTLGAPVHALLSGRPRARPPEPIATSLTLGIASLEDTLADAEQAIAQGFRCLKVKIGLDLESDLERLAKLRERFGTRETTGLRLRVDGNQGYRLDETRRLLDAAGDDPLDLELIEQPLPRGVDPRAVEPPLAPAERALLAADESLVTLADAGRLAAAPPRAGVFVLKLMKHGGITPSLDLAAVAGAHGLGLMWGCMDESVVSIAAALHAAWACPETRFLDLDGSFDLARDLFEGGFVLENGRLRPLDRPGLGVTRRS